MRLERQAAMLGMTVVTLSTFSPGVAVAEEVVDEQTRHWTVQVDPLTTVLGFVHAQVERTLGQHASVYLGPSLRLFTAPWDEPEPFLGYGGEAGVRVYPFGTAPHGWWLLGRGVLAHLRTDVNGTNENAVGGYGSALGGYTWVVGPGLVLSLGLGVQVLNYTIADMGTRGVLPAAHTAIGWAF